MLVTELLTVDDVARMLRVDPQTVYRWAWTKRLPAIRLSRRVLRFERGDVESWVASLKG